MDTDGYTHEPPNPALEATATARSDSGLDMKFERHTCICESLSGDCASAFGR
jgi:hypothetical protein